MDSLTPAEISEATFRTARKGFDPDEVRTFLEEAAQALEQARQHATAMEARARAAVARLQEARASEPPPDDAAASPPDASDGSALAIPHAEAETISRTLLLAQRTADATVAEAEAEADRIVSEARSEAEATIDSTREMSAQMLEDARAEARQASADERRVAESEVEALVARREFLIGDVDQLERFLIDQRDRLRGAARQIEALCDRVPEGLGSVRPPVLSASHDDEPGDPTQELQRPVIHDGTDDEATDDETTDDETSDDETSDDETTHDAGTDGGPSDEPSGEADQPILPTPTLPAATGTISRLAGALDESSGESELPRRYPRS